MPSVMWWVQLIGGALSIVVTLGAILTVVYSLLRDAPKWLRRITRADVMEQKIDDLEQCIEVRFDRLTADHELSQELQLQQAEEFDKLAVIVADEHGVRDGERPSMNPEKIRHHLMGDDEMPDFTRGPGGGPPPADD